MIDTGHKKVREERKRIPLVEPEIPPTFSNQMSLSVYQPLYILQITNSIQGWILSGKIAN